MEGVLRREWESVGGRVGEKSLFRTPRSPSATRQTNLKTVQFTQPTSLGTLFLRLFFFRLIEKGEKQLFFFLEGFSFFVP